MGTIYIIGAIIFAVVCILTHFKLQSIIEGRSVAKNQTTAKSVAIRISMIEDMKSSIGDSWKTYFNIVTFGVIAVLTVVWPISIGIIIGIRIFAICEK